MCRLSASPAHVPETCARSWSAVSSSSFTPTRSRRARPVVRRAACRGMSRPAPRLPTPILIGRWQLDRYLPACMGRQDWGDPSLLPHGLPAAETMKTGRHQPPGLHRLVEIIADAADIGSEGRKRVTEFMNLGMDRPFARAVVALLPLLGSMARADVSRPSARGRIIVVAITPKPKRLW